jgi:predicted ribosome quality control (RQC) complex YloA/Tae2 family protein
MALRPTFDSLTLRAVLDELRRTIVHGQIQHIRAMGADEVALEIRASGQSRTLLLSCDPQAARIHLISAKPTGPLPPADRFIMSLRKHVEDGRMVGARQIGFDRIAEFVIASHGREYRLVCELMGKHSNIVLLDDSGTIVDCARHVGRSVNRHRVLLPGQAYVDAPPPSGSVDLFGPEGAHAWLSLEFGDPETLAASIKSLFQGISPFLAAELAARASEDGPQACLDDVVGRAERGQWEPVLLRDARGQIQGAYPIPLRTVDKRLQQAAPSVNEAVALTWAEQAERRALETRRGMLARQIGDEMAHRERRLAEIDCSIAGRGEAERLMRSADLLLASASHAGATGSEIELHDLYDAGKAVRIKIDPTISLAENAARFYERAKRLRRAADWAEPQRRHIEHEQRLLQEAAQQVSSADTVEGLEAAASLLVSAGLLRSRKGPSTAESPGRSPARDALRGIRQVEAPDGWTILIGLNAEGNDRLLRSVCRPDDVWFHVRSHASAHVVVRNPERKAELPRKIVEHAALLAARSSKAKHSSVVPVDYTFCKYVRPPPRGGPRRGT